MADKILVTRSSMPSFEEYCEEIKELWDSRWLTNMGVKHQKLEQDLKEYLGVENLTLYTNGHLALENILEAYEFPKGGEVITTPFTFASTTHAIVRCGLIPVFCDVNPHDYTMDVTKIEELITEKTCAILPVHVYGNMCDTEAIDRIAKKHSLKVIYDAAHAFGVTYKGKNAAFYGDASMFSFHATKVFNTVEGGAVTYRDETLKKVLDDRKNFGLFAPEDVRYASGNAKMSEFQAAMGICNLRHLSEEIGKRKLAVDEYRKRLFGIEGIRLIKENPDTVSNYAYFPVVFEGDFNREEVAEKLAANDIVARKYFSPLTNAFECYKDLPTAGAEKTPVAQYLADRVLTLPLYAGLTVEEVNRICDIILSK